MRMKEGWKGGRKVLKRLFFCAHCPHLIQSINFYCTVKFKPVLPSVFSHNPYLTLWALQVFFPITVGGDGRVPRLPQKSIFKKTSWVHRHISLSWVISALGWFHTWATEKEGAESLWGVPRKVLMELLLRRGPGTKKSPSRESRDLCRDSKVGVRRTWEWMRWGHRGGTKQKGQWDTQNPHTATMHSGGSFFSSPWLRGFCLRVVPPGECGKILLNPFTSLHNSPFFIY